MIRFLKLVFASSIIVLLFACIEQTQTTDTTKMKRTEIELITNKGTMVLSLYNETPLHRDNFINLTKHRAYDSVLFHRVIKDFMIQAGDPDSRKATATDTLGEGDVPYKVAAEFNADLFHKKGVLAAARDNNPEKSSSGMQFYIVHGKIFNDSTLERTETYRSRENAKEFFKDDATKKLLLNEADKAMKTRSLDYYNRVMDSLLVLAKMETDFQPYSIPNNQRDVYKTSGGTPHLDQNYTVFGEVVQGLGVLDSIINVQTNTLDRPIHDVRILSMRLLD